MSGYTLGNGATVSLGYGTNGRLRLSEIILAKNGTTLQKYQYSYGQIVSGSVDTTKNNGQLAQVDSWIGSTQEYRQQYTFDSVNRLVESKETYGTSLGSTAYDIKYRYDAFGNREQRSSDNSGNSAITQKWVESGDFDLDNNRYDTGVSYDAAGNITADPRFRNLLYGYDANGRQNYSAQANGSSPVTTIFDGAGRRVATKASGYLSVMVYDAGGKLSAEYSQFTAPTTANVDFITPNHQGSTSVVTDHAGAVKSRHDYLPFGEEIGDGVGSRTTAKKFSQSDPVRHKYAGMEMDDATGLNHTLWRKDDNWSGRWTSPDPYGGSMFATTPQSFNRYTYCNNDPINSVDPSGLALSDIGVYQTDNPAVAGTLETEMTRRFRVLTSPGGRAYVEAQKKAAEESKEKTSSSSGETVQGNSQAETSGLMPGFQMAMDAEADRVADEYLAGVLGEPANEQSDGADRQHTSGPDRGPDSVIGSRVYGTFTDRYNCMGYALSRKEWLVPPEGMSPLDYPGTQGGIRMSCSGSVPEGRAKIKVYVDSANVNNWHVARKDYRSRTWSNKNAADYLRTGIRNPDAAFRSYYRPIGPIIIKCWDVPVRLVSWGRPRGT